MTLKSSAFTVRSAAAEDSAIVRFRGGEPRSTMDDAGEPSRGRLRLSHCVVRGNTGLLQWDGRSPVRAELRQCGLALGRPLVTARPSGGGGDDDAGLSLTIDQSTVVSESGFLDLEASRGQRPARITVDAAENVIAQLDGGVPLVRLSGGLGVDEFERLLIWQGSGNLFSGRTGVQIESDGVMPEEVNTPLDEWLESLSAASVGDRVVAVPTAAAGEDVDRDLATYEPADFGPARPTETNPITGAAGDRDAGLDWRSPELPTFAGGDDDR